MLGSNDSPLGLFECIGCSAKLHSGNLGELEVCDKASNVALSFSASFGLNEG